MGSSAEAASVEVEEKLLTADELSIADFHTYFVVANENAAPVWVHNRCFDGLDDLYVDYYGTQNGRPVYDYLYPDTGQIRQVYQGTDGRYYDTIDHPMDATTGIPETPSTIETVDNWQTMTTPQATQVAGDLGYNRVIDYPFNSHGQPVYWNGQYYISPDIDGHNGGVWKIFDRQGNRLGTADSNLEIFKD